MRTAHGQTQQTVSHRIKSAINKKKKKLYIGKYIEMKQHPKYVDILSQLAYNASGLTT